MLLVEFLKKHTDGKKVKITIRVAVDPLIVEFSPEGEFMLLEEQVAFGMGKPGKQVLIDQ